jgi:hypothetical protein
VQPSLRLPPITGLSPGAPAREPATVREPDVLTAYLTTTRSWHRHPVALPTSVVCALWIILGGAVGVGVWLTVARAWDAPAGGIVFRIATLGHPGLLLILAIAGALTLLGLAPFTGGLTRAGGPELAAMTLAGAAGAASLLGVVAVALIAIAAVFLVVALFVAVVERT